MVQPGTPEWDELVKDGWVLSADELAKLTEAAGAQEDEPATKRGDGGESKGSGRVFRESMTVDEEASDEAKEIESWRRRSGLPPTIVRRGVPHVVAVRITEEAHTSLKEIAASFGWLHGGDGNLTALFEAIGQGKLVVRHRDEGKE